MTNSSHDSFMSTALDVARAGLERGELPVGAVVVADGKVVAAAHTMERAENRLLVHAELLALDSADRLTPFPGSRRSATLYCTSEPCMMCLGAAMSFGIGTICYAHEVPSDGAIHLLDTQRPPSAGLPFYRAPRVESGVRRNEAIALFAEYVRRNPTGPLTRWAQSVADLENS